MPETFEALAGAWSAAMLRVLGEGALVLGGAWALSLALRQLPSAARSWLWRAAYLRLLLAALCLPPLLLPILPAPDPEPPVAVPAVRLPESAAAPPPVRPHSIPPAADAAETIGSAPSPKPLPVATWLFAAWLAGVCWCALRLWGDWVQARRLARSSRPAGDAVTRIWAELCARNGVGSAPPVREVPGLPSPLLLHGLRPVVLVPAGLAAEWPEGEIRLMLAHELAHLRRRDLWWSWLPAAAHCLFYFHPILWLANREWRLAQEIACDELALQMTSSPAAPYGAMLVKLALRPTSSRRLGLAAVDADSPKTLERRLIAMRRMNSTGKRRLLLSAGLAALAGTAILLPIRVTAQTPAEPGEPAEPTVTVRAVPAPEAPEKSPAAPRRSESDDESFERRQQRLQEIRDELERRMRDRQRESAAAAGRAENARRAAERLRAAHGDHAGHPGHPDPERARELREAAEAVRRQALEALERAQAETERLFRDGQLRESHSEALKRAREQVERSLREPRGEGGERFVVPPFPKEEVERALREAEVHSSRALEHARRALTEAQRTLPEKLKELGPDQRKQLHEELERELKRLPQELERAMAEVRSQLQRERGSLAVPPRPERPERPVRPARPPRPEGSELRESSRAELEARIRALEEQIRALRSELEKRPNR
ncbi:MAG: M56 family metallopeptidase [Armatimonadota bacterium]